MFKKIKNQFKRIVTWYQMRKIAKSMTEHIEVSKHNPLENFNGMNRTPRSR